MRKVFWMEFAKKSFDSISMENTTWRLMKWNFFLLHIFGCLCNEFFFFLFCMRFFLLVTFTKFHIEPNNDLFEWFSFGLLNQITLTEFLCWISTHTHALNCRVHFYRLISTQCDVYVVWWWILCVVLIISQMRRLHLFSAFCVIVAS